MQHLILLLFSVGLASAQTGDLKYRDCGSRATLVSATVTPCDSDPCVIRRGQSTTVSMKIIPHVSSSKVTLDGRFRLWGIYYPIPDLETDLCRSVDCPIKANEPTRVSQSFSINEWSPSFSTNVTLKVMGDDGSIMACIEADVVID